MQLLWAAKTKLVLCSFLLSQMAISGGYLAKLGFPSLVPPGKRYSGLIVNPLLTKHIRSRRLDIGHVLFCVFTDFDLVSGLKKNFGLASILRYHMTGSASGYHETNTVFWSATGRASEMGLSCPLGVFRVGPARKIKRTWLISSLSRSCPHSWLITHTWL